MMMRGSSCDCYTKLKAMGIPFILRDEEAEKEKLLANENIPVEKVVEPPGMLRINDHCEEYPLVEEQELHVVFQHMSRIVLDLSDYELNILNFWILDMYIEGLLMAQKAGFDHKTQRTTLYWITYMFNYVQLNDITRREAFKNLRKVLLIPPEETIQDSEESELGEQQSEGESGSLTEAPPAEPVNANAAPDITNEIANEEEGEGEVEEPLKGIWEIPLPPLFDFQKDSEEGYGEMKKGYDPESDAGEEEDGEKSGIQITRSYEERMTQANVESAKVLLDILYRIFGLFFVYKQLRMAIFGMPNAQMIDVVLPLNIPKPLKIPEPEAPPPPAPKGKGAKGAVILISPEELAAKEEEKRKHKNDAILPLKLAEGTKLYVRRLFGIPSNESFLLAQASKKKGKK